MSDLAAIVDEVEQDLKDSGNDVWSAAEIENHVRRALHEVNRVQPQRLDADITPVEGERVYALDDLADPIDILDLWYPYDDDAVSWPLSRPLWSRLTDDSIMLLLDAPPSAEDAAIYTVHLIYTSPHTIDDLDGATATTLDTYGELLVVQGAAAYAALQYAQSVIGKVTASGSTPQQLSDWAAFQLRRFKDGLEALRRQHVLHQDPRTTWQGAV